MTFKKKLLPLFLLGLMTLPSVYAKSTADASIKWSGRSGLPSTTLSAGYSFGIWGKVPEPGAEKKDPMYGYARLAVDATWAFNTKTNLKLDIHPVSIAKISVGMTSSSVVENFDKKYDDAKINQPGKYNGMLISVSSIIPIAGELNGYVSYESETMKNKSDATLPMLNWSYNLYADGGGDTRQTMFGALFYKLSDDWSIAALFDSTKMKTSGSKSTGVYAGGSSKFNIFGEDFSYFVAGGVFSADNGTYDANSTWTGELSNGKRSDGFVVIYNLTYHFKKGFSFP
jgi:hypothetical protein